MAFALSQAGCQCLRPLNHLRRSQPYKCIAKNASTEAKAARKPAVAKSRDVRSRISSVSRKKTQKTPKQTYTEEAAQEMLLRACTKAGVTIEAQTRIVELAKILVAAGETHNLSGVRTLAGALVVHAVDALALLPDIDASCVHKVADVGAGAGFPGLVLAVARPDLQVTLVEATRKKIDFQTHAISMLGLQNAKPLWARAEDFAREEGRETFDCAVARAVARLDVLAELAIPLVHSGGFFIAQKSLDRSHTEVSQGERAIRKLGGELVAVHPSWTELIVRDVAEQFDEKPQSTDDRQKCLVIVKKIKRTTAEYPRLHNAIKKKPL